MGHSFLSPHSYLLSSSASESLIHSLYTHTLRYSSSYFLTVTHKTQSTRKSKLNERKLKRPAHSTPARQGGAAYLVFYSRQPLNSSKMNCVGGTLTMKYVTIRGGYNYEVDVHDRDCGDVSLEAQFVRVQSRRSKIRLNNRYVPLLFLADDTS